MQSAHGRAQAKTCLFIDHCLTVRFKLISVRFQSHFRLFDTAQFGVTANKHAAKKVIQNCIKISADQKRFALKLQPVTMKYFKYICRVMFQQITFGVLTGPL